MTFNVPHLDDAPPEPPPGDPEAAQRAQAAREAQYAANRSRKTRGFIIGGAGVAVAAVGGVFGVLAILKNSDAKSACAAPCINGSTQAKTSNSATDRALLSANVANVAIPIGALVTILGGYLMLSAGPTSGGAGASGKTAFIAPHAPAGPG